MTSLATSGSMLTSLPRHIGSRHRLGASVKVVILSFALVEMTWVVYLMTCLGVLVLALPAVEFVPNEVRM